MKLEINLEFLIITTFFLCVHSLSIRDFSSQELNDEEPDHTNYADVARYVVHKSEWASMGTISTLKSISGFPMVNIISVADSVKGEESTGHIYFYLTNLDYTGQDLLKDNKLTVMFSNDQDLECTKKGVDPMEPTCARIMISGSAVELEVNSTEYNFAKRAFLSHHPAASVWIKTHSFYLCKLDILQIVVLDWYGGPHYVTSEDYYNANKTLDGFLEYGISTNEIQVVKNKRDLNQAPAFTINNDDKKIKIKIRKDNDVVMIEL